MTRFQKFRIIVNDNHTKGGRIFDWFFITIIFLSAISFSIETLPSMQKYHYICRMIEMSFVLIFTVEYLVRLVCAENRLKFVTSIYSIIDLIAILPYYLSMGLVDLRNIRLLRIVRIFVLLKLIRYNKALGHLSHAVHKVKYELLTYLFITLMLIYVSATGIYIFEHEAQPEAFSSVFASMWWAIVTITTVGYGDVYPITVGGKIFACFVLLLGVAMAALPAAILASALTKSDHQ